MKNTMLYLLAFLMPLTLLAQIPVIPAKPDHVSEEDYRKGKHILENAISQIGETAVCYADYWNFAVSLGLMGQDEAIVWKYVVKAKESDPTRFCTLVKYETAAKGGIEKTGFYKRFNLQYLSLLESCTEGSALSQNMEPLKDASHYKGYNYALIQKLHAMMEKDQQYRRNNLYTQNREKQTKLDDANQQELIKLFAKYGYPGKSLVGPEYCQYASLILEHGSDLSIQEKYLPLVVEAYHQQEVNKAILWMLIDRIHWKKTGKQIFGSHVGVDFDSEEVIKGVKEKYKL